MIDPPQVRPEEPTAVTPHGGICGGESQQWLSYPTKLHARICEGESRMAELLDRDPRHSGYAVSGRVRKRIEEVFGWTKTAAGFRKTRHRGLARVGWMFTLTATAYNLVRLPKLVAAVA